jgi:hypothetical protein
MSEFLGVVDLECQGDLESNDEKNHISQLLNAVHI